MPIAVNERVRRPGFAEECRWQSAIVAESDEQDRELDSLLEAALADVSNGF